MSLRLFISMQCNCVEHPAVEANAPSVDGKQDPSDAKRPILPSAEELFWSGNWTLVSWEYIPPPEEPATVWATLISKLFRANR
jgi:hypothetical protein